MSKRYEWINGETSCDSDQMYDNETGNKTQPVYVADLLNEQDQKIKDLEHRLANTRIKYFIGFDIEFNEVVKELDLNSVLPLWMNDIHFKFYDTEEEAKAKLRSLEDESN